MSAIAGGSVIATAGLMWFVSGALSSRQPVTLRASGPPIAVTPGNSQQALFADDANTTKVELQQLTERGLKDANPAAASKTP